MQPILPDRYLITPEPASAGAEGGYDDRIDNGFLATLSQALAAGIRLVQLRSRALETGTYRELAREAARLCAGAGARLVLNPPDPERDLESVREMAGLADGIHLTSRSLMASRFRPAAPGRLVSAACHTAAELAQARRIGVDFVTLSPVLPTLTHPEAAPLGWERFAAMIATAELPVFALGGMSPDDLPVARRHGAHGIASIRGLWPARAAGQAVAG